MIRVAEMFAGVGGFRLALEGYGKPGDGFYKPPAGRFETVWANQWEPPGTGARQFAWKCYEERFGEGSCVNEDIEAVLDAYEAGEREIPDFDMLVGGFPCQDHSVAKPAGLAKGLEGAKGVLWWSIERMVRLKEPKYVLLENVDRLLKSPTAQRGRDFAVMLSCLARLGYDAEWRVVNAADYGLPQRRRRVFILAWRRDAVDCHGALSRAFPCSEKGLAAEFDVPDDPYEASKSFGGGSKSPFSASGSLTGLHVRTCDVETAYSGPKTVLGDVLAPSEGVPGQFYVDESDLGRWEYLKGAKREPRTAPNGYEYVYSEGPVAFPDALDKPARTILTGEGGKSPSRMKHVVRDASGRLRRLVPDELDALQCFPSGWTRGMSDSQRAFCMGNALVVDVPHRIGREIDALEG